MTWLNDAVNMNEKHTNRAIRTQKQSMSSVHVEDTEEKESRK